MTKQDYVDLGNLNGHRPPAELNGEEFLVVTDASNANFGSKQPTTDHWQIVRFSVEESREERELYTRIKTESPQYSAEAFGEVRRKASPDSVESKMLHLRVGDRVRVNWA